MSLNPKCPHCGGTRTVLTSEHKRHGCLWLILFRIYYVIWTVLRWIVGLIVFLLFDWWVAILKALAGKGYVFKSKRFFSPWRRYYYCPDCGTNFRG